MAPTFSIIIPAHNEEKYIRETLHSIKTQTNQDYEVVVVTNGCTDKTEEIIRKKASRRIKHVSLPRANVSAARNAGAEVAEGKVLVFLDADTTLSPNSLQCVNEQFNGIHAVGTMKVRPDITKLKYTTIMGLKNVLTSTKLFKGFGGVLICYKEYFDLVKGYNSDIKVKEHHDLRKKLEEKGKYVCVNTYVTTSMRRLEDWSVLWASWFWVKQLGKYYSGKGLHDSEYEHIE